MLGTELTIGQLTKQIFATGQLTHHDRQRLKKALLDEWISNEELALIERVIDGVRRSQLLIVG